MGESATKIDPNLEIEDLKARLSAAEGALAQRAAELDKAHTAAEAAQDLFHALVENTADAIVLVDRAGRFRFASAGTRRVLGRPPEDLVGRGVFDLVHPDDVARCREAFATGFASPGVLLHAELRYLHQDGTYRDVEAEGVNRFDEPRIGAVVVSFRDVSERKRAAEEMKSQTELLANLLAVARATTERPSLAATLQNTLDVVKSLTGAEGASLFVLDADGAAVNSIFSHIHLDPIAQPEDTRRILVGGLAGWVARNQQAALVPDTSKDPRWITLQDHEVRPRSALCVPITSGSHLVGLVTLIHTRPGYFEGRHLELLQAAGGQMALALENAGLYENLEREREQLSALIQSSRDGILLVGAAGAVLVVNDRAVRLLSLPGEASAWRGRPVAELCAALSASLGQTSLGLSVAGDGEESGELESSERCVSWLNLPVRTASAALGRLLVFRDVTDERRLARFREDLTHTMVHDLRTPLTSIQGFLKLVLGTSRVLQGGERDLVERAESASERLRGMVDSILDISRLESGQMPVELRSVDVVPLVVDVLQLQSALIHEKELRLAHAFDGAPCAHADPALLTRVLQNLVGNAVKFTPRGGEVRVAVGRDPTDPRLVTVTVSDTGPGLPASLRGRLFQKFASGREPGSGSGLGLAFCKLAVEAHGGRIRVTGEPGAGTTAEVAIPADAPESETGAPA